MPGDLLSLAGATLFVLSVLVLGKLAGFLFEGGGWISLWIALTTALFTVLFHGLAWVWRRVTGAAIE